MENDHTWECPMGVLDLLPFLGGGAVHHECRQCGMNLQGERHACPTCGGDVATYEVRDG